jgi:hypothetical protein
MISMTSHKWLCCIVLFFLFHTFIVAQTHSVVSGVIRNADGEHIIGASVSLAAVSDTTLSAFSRFRQSITNKYGYFALPSIPKGAYILRVRSLGYGVWQQSITVGEQSTPYLITLPSEDIQLSAISIEGSQSKSLVSTVQLSSAIFRQAPSLGSERDVFRVVQLLPGVKAGNEFSSGLYIRGSSPDQNLILLDGVPVYNPTHLFGMFSTFNADAISDIKLYKGAFPAEFGGRLSSVLDVTMKEGAKEKLGGAAHLSFFSARLQAEGPIGKQASFAVSARRMYLDALLGLVDPEGASPRYNFFDVNAKINYTLSESDRLFASGYLGRDVFTPMANISAAQSLQWGNATAHFRWTHIFSPSLFATFSASYTDYDFAYKDRLLTTLASPLFQINSRIQNTLLTGEAQWFASPEHTVKFGTQAIFHTLRSLIDAENTVTVDMNSVTKTSAIEYAAFVQDEWQILPTLQATLGLRGTYFSNGNYARLEPRSALRFEMSDATTIKGAFAVTNQFLHLLTQSSISLPTETWFPANTSIQPSQSIQYVLGVEHLLNGKEIFLSLEGYYKSLRNIYEFKDNAEFRQGVPLEAQITNGSGEAFGVECFAHKRVGSFTGWIGYTLAWTTRLFPSLNNGKMFFANYDRRHDIQIVAHYTLSDEWEFGASWIFQSGQPITIASSHVVAGFISPSNSNGNRTFIDTTPSQQLYYSQRNSVRLPPAHRLDVNVAHNFTWFSLPFQIALSVFNVYNNLNPFAGVVEYKTPPALLGGASQHTSAKLSSGVRLRQYGFFSILPTLSLSCTF